LAGYYSEAKGIEHQKNKLENLQCQACVSNL
jgi:hypothetical protein